MWLKRIGIVIAAIIPVAIVGSFVFSSTDNSAEDLAPTAGSGTPMVPSAIASGSETLVVPSTITTSTTEPATESSMYANGTYTAEGAYTSPAGAESITVTLTLADDVVTAVSAEPHGVGPSALWQGKCISGLQAAVVGKNINELNLTKVSGSSLTPIGFNAAVKTIKTQAEV